MFFPIVNLREVTGMKGLATTLVAGPVSLELRIDYSSPLMQGLLSVRNAMIGTMPELAAGRQEPGEVRLGEGEDDSRLLLDIGSSPVHLLELLGMLAMLADVFRRLDNAAPDAPFYPFLHKDERARAWFPDLWIHLRALVDDPLAHALESAGIASDRDFREHHDRLPIVARVDAALARHSVAQVAAFSDSRTGPRPSVLVAGLPPWLDDAILPLVGVVPKLKRLVEHGFETFSELAELDDEGVRAARGVDGDTLKAIGKRLEERMPDIARWALQKSGSVEWVSEDWQPKAVHFFSLAELLTWLMSRIDRLEGKDRAERDELGKVLEGRVGEPAVGPHRPLRELSRDMGRASQETARSAERRVVRALLADDRVHCLMEDIGQRIKGWIRENRQAVPMGPNCPVSCLVTREPVAAARFLNLFFGLGKGLPSFDLSEDGMSVIESGGLDDFDRVRKELLDELAARKSVADRAYAKVQPLLAERLRQGSMLVRGELHRQVVDMLNWSGEPPDKDDRLVSLGRSVEAAVVAVLARAGKSLGRAEILAGCAEAPFELELKSGSLGNLLVRLTQDPLNRNWPHLFEGVFQVGHGQYACQGALPVDIDALADLVEQARSLIIDGRRSIWTDSAVGDAYQWHCKDLLEELRKHPAYAPLEPIEANLSWHLLDGALRYHRPDGVVNLQKGFWMAKLPGLDEAEHEKLDQNEVVEWVLTRFSGGEPMALGPIRDKIVQVQSLGATDQLQVANKVPADSNFIKVGRGLLELKS